MSIKIRIAAILLSSLATALFALDIIHNQNSSYASDRTSDNESTSSNARSAGSTGRPTSNLPADMELAHEIDRAIDESEFASARWGVFVMSLRDGRILYSRDGGRLFTPASNMKIYTTAVALDLLGSDYHWRTSVYAARQIDASGTLDGDLILYGRGAPDLDSFKKDGLPALAVQLGEQGLRRVRGNIVGDQG